MTDRVVITRPATSAPDAWGNVETSATVEVVSGRGAFTPGRMREAHDGGRVQSEVAGVLEMRASRALKSVRAGDTCEINRTAYQIVGIARADQFGRFMKLEVERGTAI